MSKEEEIHETEENLPHKIAAHDQLGCTGIGGGGLLTIVSV